MTRNVTEGVDELQPQDEQGDNANQRRRNDIDERHSKRLDLLSDLCPASGADTTTHFVPASARSSFSSRFFAAASAASCCSAWRRPASAVALAASSAPLAFCSASAAF